MKIIEAVNPVILGEQVIVESNHATADTFMVSSHRSKSEYLINKVTKLIISFRNENNMIDKVENLTIIVGN